MKDRDTGRVDSSTRFSRRRFLKVAGYTAAIAAEMAASHDVRVSDVMHAIEVAREYGPEVGWAVLRNPSQSLDAYELWKTPEKSYEKSQLLKVNLEYKKGARNNVVGFGDSNIVGPDGTQWRQSPLKLYITLARDEYGFNNWTDYNCARSGFTTDRIINEQINSDRAKQGLEMGVKSDVWVNAGGNDMSDIVHDDSEADELAKLGRDPFGDMDLLFKYTKRIADNIQAFEGNFLNLLHAIRQPEYAPNIRQFIVMSAPDFGKVRSIITQEIDGQAHIIELTSAAARRLVGNIAVHMNNAMFRAAETFAQEGNKVAGINTATPDISNFSSNQHFSLDACRKIAEVAASRVSIVSG